MVRISGRANVFNVCSSIGEIIEYGLEDFMKFYRYDVEIEHWVGTRIRDYAYNYVYKGAYTSVYIGYCHNSEKRGKKTRYSIEFNPNKIDDKLRMFLYEFKERFIKPDSILIMIHYAVDLYDVDINQVIIDKQKKQIYKVFDGPKGRTYYIGEYGQDGYLKVYDKAKEQGKEGKWTRIEYYLRIDKSLKALEGYVPKGLDLTGVYILKDVESPEDKALIYALRNGVITLHDLSRYKRRRLESACMEKFEIDKKEVVQKILDFRDFLMKLETSIR